MKTVNELIVHNPMNAGDNNEKLRIQLGNILDNWRKVTPIQASIALTLYEKHKPAECMSTKQAWHINKAIAVLTLSDTNEPDGE